MWSFNWKVTKIFKRLINSLITDVPYDTEINTLICSANRWTGFYMIGNSIMKMSENLKIMKNQLKPVPMFSLRKYNR